MEMSRKIMREGRVLDLIQESAVVNYVAPALMESENGTEEKDGHWVADVWKLGEENLNGRIYTEELAQRLIRENPVTMAYDGHLCDWINGNEYKNAVAICKNLRVEDGVMKTDIEFLECEKEYEAKLKELAFKGIAIGVSSVGYGEYEEDGKTINPETYTIVRILDFVTQPAGEVYATLTSEEAEDAEPVAELSAEAMARKDKLIADFLKKYVRS